MNEMNKLLLLSLWLSFFSISLRIFIRVLLYYIRIFIRSFIIRVIVVINPDVYETGPRGSKHYIFGDRFYSKNVRKLRF